MYNSRSQKREWRIDRNLEVVGSMACSFWIESDFLFGNSYTLCSLGVLYLKFFGVTESILSCQLFQEICIKIKNIASLRLSFQGNNVI